ncbi:MAG TPA: YceI family protein [Arachidicoccus sp.]
MKKIILCLLVCTVSYSLKAQKFFTRNGEISFNSKTPAETIQAENKQVLAIIDPEAKQVAFNLLIKGFLFQKQLMQDHFNEEVMESDKFPKASFTGKITDAIDLAKIGKYHVHITGQLTMHGITKPISAEANIDVSSSAIKAACAFKVAYEDYNIKMPSVLQNNISKTIAISVNADCLPMAK